MTPSFLSIERVTDMQGQELHPETIPLPPATLAEAFQWGQDGFCSFGWHREFRTEDELASEILSTFQNLLEELPADFTPPPIWTAGFTAGFTHAYLQHQQKQSRQRKQRQSRRHNTVMNIVRSGEAALQAQSGAKEAVR